MPAELTIRAQLLALSKDVKQTLVAELAPDDEKISFLKRKKAAALRSVQLTRLESLQRLDELCSWLYVYGRDREAMAVGRSMSSYPFTGNFTQYAPVEWTLALTAWLAREHGDQVLADVCTSHIRGAYGTPAEWSELRRAALRSDWAAHRSSGSREMHRA